MAIDMDLRQLRTFLVTVDSGSLSRASQRIGIAQPALSRQIRMLEGEIGMSLFTRNHRGMVLTEAGDILVERARRIFREIDLAKAQLSGAAGQAPGTITFALLPSISDLIAPPFVRAMRARYPATVLHITTGFSGTLLRRMEDQELDFAVIYEPGSPAHLEVWPLLSEPLYLVGDPQAGPRLPDHVTLRGLAGLPLVMPGVDHMMRIFVDQAAAAAGITLTAVVDADSVQLQKAAVRAGAGLAVLPASSVAQDLLQGRICARPITEPALVRRLSLVAPVTRRRPEAIAFALAFLIQEIGALVRAGAWPGAEMMACASDLDGEGAALAS